MPIWIEAVLGLLAVLLCAVACWREDALVAWEMNTYGKKGSSTVTKTKSVYKTELTINSGKTLTLSADERKWIAEALSRAVANEVDAMPLILLMNKIVSDT